MSLVMDRLTPDRTAAIPGTARFDMTPRDGGAPYRIFLREPSSAPPIGGWPTLYLLDGNAVIATAVDALRVQALYPEGTSVEEAVIVAVGYPTDDAYDSVRRSWDLGPPPGATYPPHSEGGPDVRTGGADRFLAFLDEELKPEIASRVPVDPDRQAIFGHSFGGLFVLHALFNRPDAFSRWIAVSPAIWWKDTDFPATAARFFAAPEAAAGAKVLISVGEFEQTLAPFQVGAADEAERLAEYPQSRIVDNARDMAERLAKVDGIEAFFELYRGETHMSVLLPAVNHAVRFAFGAWSPVAEKA